MTYRPYPRTDRALRQLDRHPAPAVCPSCGDPVSSHAKEDGIRVCSYGIGRISCADCAEVAARMPAVAAMQNLGRALRTRPNASHLPVLLGAR